MIAIIDYGVGNLFSLLCSLKFIGCDAVIAGDADTIKRSDKLLLPGVGAFGDAAAMLRTRGLDEIIKGEAERHKPLLGVCLGMQLLFDESLEFGEHRGLGLLNGVVAPIKTRIPGSFKAPHIGWNALKLRKEKESKLLKHTYEGDHVYFVHSYHAENCEEAITATTEYGAELTAAVERGNIFGTQFHPEKSGNAGLNILRAFAEV